MSPMEYGEADHQGLAQALKVARSGTRSVVSEGDKKLLAFFLRDGSCDGHIGVPIIEVRFSWLKKRQPSSYFGSLAPGLMTQLMDLGQIDNIDETVEFFIPPGIIGSGLYQFSFPGKWVRIQCSDNSILVRIRDTKPDLAVPLDSPYDW